MSMNTYASHEEKQSTTSAEILLEKKSWEAGPVLRVFSINCFTKYGASTGSDDAGFAS